MPADLVPLLARVSSVKVEVKEPTGSIPFMRFNHLHPPFNNPAIRRALLGAIDQAEVMRAVAGADHATWRDRVGLFSPGSLLANEAGIEALSGPRDYDKVKRDLTAAGYHGEPIVVLTVSPGRLADQPQAGGIARRLAGDCRRRCAEADCRADATADVARRPVHSDGLLGPPYRAPAQYR